MQSYTLLCASIMRVICQKPIETVSVPRPPNLVKERYAMKRGFSHKNFIKINTTNDVSKQSLSLLSKHNHRLSNDDYDDYDDCVSLNESTPPKSYQYS